MIGVAQDDFGVEIVDQLSGGEAFYSSLRPDGHEYGSFDCAMSGVQQTGTRTRMRADGLNLESESGCQSSIVKDGNPKPSLPTCTAPRAGRSDTRKVYAKDWPVLAAAPECGGTRQVH
jgi:hypothetical protein